MRPIRSRSVGATYFGSFASTSTSAVPSWAFGGLVLVPMAGGGSGVAADQAADVLSSRPQDKRQYKRLPPPNRRILATSGMWVATTRSVRLSLSGGAVDLSFCDRVAESARERRLRAFPSSELGTARRVQKPSKDGIGPCSLGDVKIRTGG